MSSTLQKKLVRYNYVTIGWYVVMPTCIIIARNINYFLGLIEVFLMVDRYAVIMMSFFVRQMKLLLYLWPPPVRSKVLCLLYIKNPSPTVHKDYFTIM